MAVKNKLVYQCRECGFESAKWLGKCPSCGEWNTFEETLKEPAAPQKKASSTIGKLSRPTPINEISTEEESRYHTGLSELDRVLATTPGENVLIMTPVYNIFFNSIFNNGVNVQESRSEEHTSELQSR